MLDRLLSRWLKKRRPRRAGESAHLLDRASVALRDGDLEGALSIYSQALEIDASAEIYYKRANVLNRLGRLDRALADYEQAISLNGEFSNAYCNRGTVFAAMGEHGAALNDYDRAIAINPSDSLAQYNRAHALKISRRFDEALRGYERAIDLRPDYLEAHVNRGNLLQEMQRHEDAIRSYSCAIDLNPGVAEALLGRGLSEFRLGQSRAALSDIERALVVRENYLEALIDRGHVLQELRRPAEAAESYSRALALEPGQRYLIGIRRHAMMQVCDWNGLDADLSSIASGLAAGARVVPPLPLLALLDSPELQLKAAEIWVADECPLDETLGAIENRPAAERLRIGYFSADFRQHAVAMLTAALYEAHDKSRVELFAFSFGPESSDATKARLLRAFDRFIDVRSLSDAQVAALARELKIDVAIDLGGYTAYCRTGIFACRAAPIQVGYLGYMGTMASSYMDYLIADEHLIPPGEKPHYSEKVIYLPSYQANDSSREVSERNLSRAELGLSVSNFVFCCFNSNYKILPATFDSWMRILKRVPQSTLFLYVDDTTAKQHLMRAAAERGTDPSRLVFGERLPAPEYFARYRCMDLFLDTWPYNAGTTAADALWMGVPVLTLRGRSMAARMASSLLEAVGVPELITETAQSYEDLAVELATHRMHFEAIRGRLIGTGRQSPLFDPGLLAQHLENALLEAHRRRLERLEPEDIRINHAAI